MVVRYGVWAKVPHAPGNGGGIWRMRELIVSATFTVAPDLLVCITTLPYRLIIGIWEQREAGWKPLGSPEELCEIIPQITHLTASTLWDAHDSCSTNPS